MTAQAKESVSALFERENIHAPDFQINLLHSGLRKGISLSECLREAGLRADDLRYAIRPESSVAAKNPRVARLGARSPSYSKVPMVSFFSGAGGLDLGFESAGFEHLALFEHNPIFCRTLRHNRPSWSIVGPPDDSGDVSLLEETASILEDRFSIRAPFPGIFTGGPPCQPFSIAANQRFKKNGNNFKRVGFSHTSDGMLLFKFGALIRLFMPRAFLVENVTGVSEIDGGRQLALFCNQMASAGYRVRSPLRLRAENYGVPQLRERLFIVGFRGDKGWNPPRPLSRRIPCRAVLTEDVASFENHETREHRIESILRYRVLDFGKRDALGRVDRLHPDLPSKTVIAGGLAGGGRSHLHPWIPRTLSVRECARLQTFPDNYVFTGPIARQFTQVGNAVPPILACALAESIHEVFAVGEKRLR